MPQVVANLIVEQQQRAVTDKPISVIRLSDAGVSGRVSDARPSVLLEIAAYQQSMYIVGT